MNLAPDRLKREASATAFEQEPLEQALRLIALLDGLSSHPFLKPRIALKVPGTGVARRCSATGSR